MIFDDFNFAKIQHIFFICIRKYKNNIKLLTFDYKADIILLVKTRSQFGNYFNLQVKLLNRESCQDAG